MDFKFMNAKEMVEYQKDVKFRNELHDLMGKISKASAMADYYVDVDDEEYSEEAFEEVKRSGYQVNGIPFGIRIGWENPADAKEGCKLVSARVQKEYTDENIQSWLNNLSLKITDVLNKDPQTREFYGEGKIPRAILKILKEKGYNIETVTPAKAEEYIISW